ncbi:Deleted in lung and esophageal cancer protein, partial [Schistosoma japonicum]
MDENNLVCLLQKPSENRSQVISYQLSKIFKSLYQNSALDDDIISYLEAAKESDDAEHSSYIEDISKVLKQYKSVIDEVNKAESLIRNHGLSMRSNQNSEAEPPESAFSSLFNCVKVDDSFLGELGLLTKDDIYFNGKPRNYDFPITKHSPDHKDIENVSVRSTVEPVKKSTQTFGHLKSRGAKKYLKPDAIIPNRNSQSFIEPHIPIRTKMKQRRSLFQVEPKSIYFRSYQTGKVYESIVKIRNISETGRSIRVIPPKTTHFSMNEGKFPLPGSSIIAPGMAAVFTIRFMPDNLGDFEDEFLVKYENQLEPICVKLLGQKSRPQLNLLECYDLGSALKGGSKLYTIQLHNCSQEIASKSKFLFITRDAFNECHQFTAKHFIEYYTHEEDSCSINLDLKEFSLKPVKFTLESLESIIITIEFKPLLLGEYKWELVLICDNGQYFPVTFKGQGEELNLEIINISDSLSETFTFRKIDTLSNELLYFYQFPKQYPHTVAPKTMTIRNCCSESLRFQWIQENTFNVTNNSDYTNDNLIKSDDILNQRKSLSTSITNSQLSNQILPLLFTINPTTGVFESNDMKTFEISFNPIQIGTFTTQLSLILLNVPEVDEEGNCYKLDRKHLSIELKGIAEPLPISIEPPILIIPGKCLLDVPLHHTVKLVNSSLNCSVAFSWQTNFDSKGNSINSSNCSRSTMDVFQRDQQLISSMNSEIEKINDGLIVFEPTMGMITPGQSIDIDIFVSSSKSLIIKENIPCFINILRDSPLWFYIEVEFSGPTIVFDRADCNFGLMRPNETVEMNIVLTNTTPSPRKWFVQMDTFADKFTSEMKIQPTNGILKPVQSVTVNLSFTPKISRSVREVITVHTEDSEETRKLLILAEVQTPLIDFHPLQVNFSQCFWNVPITETVTVTNLNMLECDLEWIEPIGSDKEWVTVNIIPLAYRINGHQSQIFEITLCAHKQTSIEDLRIPLRVHGLNTLIYLPITAKVHGLSVNCFLLNQITDEIYKEHSQENVAIPLDNFREASTVLDFGQNVGLFEPVENWIECRNNTPIPTRICVDTGRLSIKTNYSDYENFSHKPKLGALSYLLLASQQSTENTLSSQSVLHERNDHKTDIRILYDWCSLLLKQSKGACVFAHSAITSSSYITDPQLAELKLITLNQSTSKSLTIPSWYLPGYGSLKICFICIANLWGLYKDDIHIYVLPEFDLTLESSLPPIEFSILFKVIGCPIYSLASGHFGQLSNKAVMSSDIKNNVTFLRTALPLKATRQFVRFGSVLFNGPIVKRQIRLHNPCETAIRIDWQVFLDSELEDHNQLINLLCFISEPFKDLSSNNFNNETLSTTKYLTPNE